MPSAPPHQHHHRVHHHHSPSTPTTPSHSTSIPSSSPSSSLPPPPRAQAPSTLRRLSASVARIASSAASQTSSPASSSSTAHHHSPSPSISSTRRRWTPQRRSRDPSLHDDFVRDSIVSPPKQNPTPTRRESAPHAAAMIRAVDPDLDDNNHTLPTERMRRSPPQHIYTQQQPQYRVVNNNNAPLPPPPIDDPDAPRQSFDRSQQIHSQNQQNRPPPAFVPRSTTTIVAGPRSGASSPGGPSDSPSSASKSHARRLTKQNRDVGDRESRNGAHMVAGMLSRTSSKAHTSKNHNLPQQGSPMSSNTLPRPRTRTLDETASRERSPGTSLFGRRNRIGSVNHSSNSSTNVALPYRQSQGTEYLASVPADTAQQSAPTIAPPYASADNLRRTASPPAAAANPALPTPNSRKINHLTKTLGGKMSGNVFFRQAAGGPWTQSYCSVQEDTSSLVYESKDPDGRLHMLIPELKGCVVQPAMDGDAPYLAVSSPQSGLAVQLRLLTQTDFDAWYAALLYWQNFGLKQRPAELEQPPMPQLVNGRDTDAPELAQRPASAKVRERGNSSRAIRPQSVQSTTTTKDAPVIKIGKMIFWDTDIGYSNAANRPSTGLGQPSTSRPQAIRTPSYANKRWRRISGLLRENGELKLHSDADNALLSVVQLSQLSRCAIQRLDPSVLDCDFCIAIYPQYTAATGNPQSDATRPLFLSLENRVLYEVWFVLLRAFTIPQLYGPSNESDDGEDDKRKPHDLENMLATTTTDMFRVERSLNVRVVEAKMYPPASGPSSPDTGFSKKMDERSQRDGYFAEVSLDGETRGKTVVKQDGLNPLWSESFEFLDLPPVLNSVSVIVKRRPPDAAREAEGQRPHDVQAFTSDYHGGYTGMTYDVTCGKVEIFTAELEESEKEVEKWWPITNSSMERVGDVLIRAKAEEGVILMSRDYQMLHDLLHRFSNSLTLQISQLISGELKRLCDCLLNIYQVSGSAGDWIMSLVEEEIDGIHRQETSINRLRYGKRTGSNETNDSLGTGGGTTDRELIVRDLNKHATLEANLLFRGNTLLTKSLDGHMKRVGKEYLEESLCAKIKEINDRDPDCEVDPNRVSSQADLERNWRKLLVWTQDVWKSILAAKKKCPLELRLIFRHIRACAEDRYGDFLRTVSYSSVSGFLFLRFFCPAVLNPKLFSLLKEDVKPRARRTLTLIAKSLQTMANMASFGTKEHWMEPMNAFLTQHRESFKSFIDEVCHVPAPIANSSAPGASPVYSPNIISTETHLSYTTPMTIMQRLPPTSREGFPSLPFLIDQARAFADLIQLWLESTNPPPTASGGAGGKRHSEIMHIIAESGEEDLMRFHEICTRLNARTQECLNRAERAERPNSAMSFKWEELIDQLQGPGPPDEDPRYNPLTEKIVSEPPPTLPPGMAERFEFPRNPSNAPIPVWTGGSDEDDEEPARPPRETSVPRHTYGSSPPTERNGASHPPISNNRGGSYRRGVQSRGSDHQSPTQSANASASNISSAVSSDTEHTTTALPDYSSEMRKHRERREAAKQVIQQHVEDARNKQQAEKERKKTKTPLSALRKKKSEKDEGGRKGSEASFSPALPQPQQPQQPQQQQQQSQGRSRGIDMSHV